MPIGANHFYVYQKLISDAQLKVLNNALAFERELSLSNAADKEQVSKELRALVSTLEAPLGNPITKFIEFTSRISSSTWNDFIRNVYTDLQALYVEHNKLTSTLLRHRSLLRNELDTINQSIQGICRDYDIALIQFNERLTYDTIFTEDFNIAYPSLSDNGMRLNTSTIDTLGGSLTLPEILNIKGITDGIRTTSSIDVESLGACYVFDIENSTVLLAIDNDPETVWQRIALGQRSSRFTYNGNNYNGAGFSYTINFPNQINISRLLISPGSAFGITIVGLESWNNDQWNTIPLDNETYPFDINTPYRLYFTGLIQTNKIRVVALQKYYQKRHYLIPKSHLSNVDLWTSMIEDTTSEYSDNITQDRVDYIAGYNAYQKASERAETLLEASPVSVEDIPTKDIYTTSAQVMLANLQDVTTRVGSSIWNTDIKTLNGMSEIYAYEYRYGLKHFDVEQTYFSIAGEFIKTYITNGAIVVGLDTDQVTPSGTTIQYDIQLEQDGPFYPIVPSNTTSSTELLEIDTNTRKATLRFTPTGTVNIYSNNILQSNYTIAGKEVTFDSGYLPDMMYYAVYDIAATSQIVNIIELVQGDPSLVKTLTLTGFSNGKYTGETTNNSTDSNGTIDLKLPNGQFKRPYFDYSQINSINWDIVNNLYNDDDTTRPCIVTANDIRLNDATDYQSGKTKVLIPYSSQYTKKEFTLHNDKIYLNHIYTPEDQKTLSVTYKYVVDFVKLRIRLLNLVPSNIYTTPRLYKYALKVKTG